jgi:hypothetical protein
MPRHWSEIAPADAVNITLPAEDIAGPVNEEGTFCPWPWEPQQMVGVPMGQYHCGYCGTMAIAGLPHPDYTEEVNDPRLKAQACSRSAPLAVTGPPYEAG